MDKDITKLDMFLAIVQRALVYNIVEVLFISGLVIGYSNGGVIYPVVLWIGFGIAALWTLLASLNEAQIYAKQMVHDRELYISDTLTGAFLLVVLAILTRSESWHFPVMFLLAAGQHLRYTYLSLNWLIAEKERQEKRKRDGRKDN